MHYSVVQYTMIQYNKHTTALYNTTQCNVAFFVYWYWDFLRPQYIPLNSLQCIVIHYNTFKYSTIHYNKLEDNTIPYNIGMPAMNVGQPLQCTMP